MNTARPTGPRFVAGVLGPTNRTACLSPDVNDPGFRNIHFDELVAAYTEATRALVEGGVDILLVETIFDTLNAKAALFAIQQFFDDTGIRLPVMISGTITDASGRTLSGQTTEAFWNSLCARPPAVHRPELRAGRDATAALRRRTGPHRRHLRFRPSQRRPAQCLRRIRRNAGTDGGGDPRIRRKRLSQHRRRLLRHHARPHPRHRRGGERSAAAPIPAYRTALPAGRAGAAEHRPADSLFVNVGERTNVTGSAVFKRLIKDGDYNAALDVARQQVENGAQIIDINMDEGMLDSKEAMVTFLNLIAAEPDIAGCR